MNNEPVGYIPNIALPTLTEEKHWVVINATKFDESDIPLYTHPSEHDLGIAEAIGFEKGHKSAEDMLRQQQTEIEVYKEALEKLARLGNGDNYGNSIGNDIAIDALRKAQEK